MKFQPRDGRKVLQPVIVERAVEWLNDAATQDWMARWKIGLWLTVDPEGEVFGSVHPGLNGIGPDLDGLGSLTGQLNVFTALLKGRDGLDHLKVECGPRPLQDDLVIIQLALTEQQVRQQNRNLPAGGVQDLCDRLREFRLHARLRFRDEIMLGQRVFDGAPGGHKIREAVVQPSVFLWLEGLSTDYVPRLIETLVGCEEFPPFFDTSAGYILRTGRTIQVYQPGS
jgi:hypothetical protein